MLEFINLFFRIKVVDFIAKFIAREIFKLCKKFLYIEFLLFLI